MTFPSALTGAIVSNPELWSDFIAICDCGGRVAGTLSERRALDLIAQRGSLATAREVDITSIFYDGWTYRPASLELIEADKRIPLACNPLLM